MLVHIWFVKLPVRFIHRMKNDLDALSHLLLWAFVAEALNRTWVPLLTSMLSQTQHIVASLNSPVGLFLNCIGAMLAGLASSVLQWHPDRGAALTGESDPDDVESAKGAAGKHPAAFRVAAAFKDGFVPCLTSFSRLGEHMASTRTRIALLVTLGIAFFGGPLLFWLGHSAGGLLRIDACCGEAAAESSERHVRNYCRRVQMVLLAFVLLTLLFEASFGDAGSGGALGLTYGIFAVSLGASMSDLVAMFLEELFGILGCQFHTTWATVVRNIVACFLRILATPAFGGEVFALGETFRGSFCGMLSAYGEFCEDIAFSVASKRHRRYAKQSFACHVVIAFVTAASLRSV